MEYQLDSIYLAYRTPSPTFVPLSTQSPGWRCHEFVLEGKTSGVDAPGGLPLILRFSRPKGCYPVGQTILLPVGLLSRAGTLILVIWNASAV
jgi:hypothetical protein